MSTAGQPSTLPVASSVNDSGPIALSASEPDLGLSSTGRLVGSQPANSPDAAEGGYVEIGDIPLVSKPFTPAEETPRWKVGEGSAGDPYQASIKTYRAISAALRRMTVGRRTSVPMASSTRTGGTELRTLAERREGGMVELAAAAPQDAEPISTKLPAAEHGVSLPNVKEIELDNGLGLFHAFKLATTPIQPGDQGGKGAGKTSPAGIPPQANVAPTPADPSAVKGSASADKLGQTGCLPPWRLFVGSRRCHARADRQHPPGETILRASSALALIALASTGTPTLSDGHGRTPFTRRTCTLSLSGTSRIA